MQRVKRLILSSCRLLFFVLINIAICKAQYMTPNELEVYAPINPSQQEALDLLAHADTVSTSAICPHIKPALFFDNLRQNILYPLKVTQGRKTNFCSYAALTHLLVLYQPHNYTRMMLSLYQTGETQLYSKRVIKVSQRIRDAAGLLGNNGKLNILHADQLWFLTMADNFKGYVNLFDHKYKIGDENTPWAVSNYHKFNRMLVEVSGYKVHSIGYDLMRPWKNKNNLYKYTARQLETGSVIMYINKKLMYPQKFSFSMPLPSHFVVLYELKEADDMIKIKYWDYGMKTEMLISKKRFKKSIYGISCITEK